MGQKVLTCTNHILYMYLSYTEFSKISFKDQFLLSMIAE